MPAPPERRDSVRTGWLGHGVPARELAARLAPGVGAASAVAVALRFAAEAAPTAAPGERRLCAGSAQAGGLGSTRRSALISGRSLRRR